MKMENQITINNNTIVTYTVKTIVDQDDNHRSWEVMFTNTDNGATAELWLEEGYLDCAEWNDYDENFLGDDQPDFSDNVDWAYGHTHSTLFREIFIKQDFIDKFVCVEA